MFRKITAGALVMLLLTAVLSISVLADPYAEINIAGDKVTEIEATDFDEEPYYETNLAEVQHGVRDHEIQTEVGSSGYNGNIGWTAADEWVQYTINVARGDKYKFEVYGASGAESAGNVEISYNDTVIGVSDDILNLGGDAPWQAYDWYNVGEVDMTAGTHVLKVLFVNGSCNLAAIRVTPLNPAVPEDEAPAPAVEEPANDETQASDDEAETTTTAPSNSNDDGGGNMILWIIVAAAAVVIIVVIVVFAMKKKK